MREVELQMSDDAKMVAWQAETDCACCPFDCIFWRAHWEIRNDSVVVLVSLASHMFSNMPVQEMGEIVRLVFEHRARVIWGAPIMVTVDVL